MLDSEELNLEDLFDKRKSAIDVLIQNLENDKEVIPSHGIVYPIAVFPLFGVQTLDYIPANNPFLLKRQWVMNLRAREEIDQSALDDLLKIVYSNPEYPEISLKLNSVDYPIPIKLEKEWDSYNEAEQLLIKEKLMASKSNIAFQKFLQEKGVLYREAAQILNGRIHSYLSDRMA